MHNQGKKSKNRTQREINGIVKKDFLIELREWQHFRLTDLFFTFIWKLKLVKNDKNLNLWTLNNDHSFFAYLLIYFLFKLESPHSKQKKSNNYTFAKLIKSDTNNKGNLNICAIHDIPKCKFILFWTFNFQKY